MNMNIEIVGAVVNVHGLGNRARMRRRRAVNSARTTFDNTTLEDVQKVVSRACGSLWEKSCQLTDWLLPEQTMKGMIANTVCNPRFTEDQNVLPEDTVIMNHVDSTAYVDDEAYAVIYEGMCCFCNDVKCTCDPDYVARLVGKARYDPPEWEDPVLHFLNKRALYDDVRSLKLRPSRGRLVRHLVRKVVGRIRERKELAVSAVALENTLSEGNLRLKKFSYFRRWIYGDRDQVPELAETSGWFCNRRDPVVVQRSLELLDQYSDTYAKLKLQVWGMTAKDKMAATDKAALVYKVQVGLTKEIDKGKMSHKTGLALMPIMIQALSADTRCQTMIPHMLGSTC